MIKEELYELQHDKSSGQGYVLAPSIALKESIKLPKKKPQKASTTTPKKCKWCRKTIHVNKSSLKKCSKDPRNKQKAAAADLAFCSSSIVCYHCYFVVFCLFKLAMCYT